MTVTLDDLRGRARARRELPSPASAKALRLAAAVSIAELAGAVGVSSRAIVHWEKGTRTPRGRALERYGEALSALAEELGGGRAASP